MKKLPTPIGTGRPSLFSFNDSTSITIRQLRDYWHNQLHQQTRSNSINIFSKSSSPSADVIEPWMMWMPTKEEWSYKILPVTPFLMSKRMHANDKYENVLFPCVSSPTNVAQNMSENICVKEKKKDVNRQMYRFRRSLQTIRTNSKHTKRQKQRREEMELIEYKKRFGFFAKTETKKELSKKIQQRKSKENSIYNKELTSNCKPPNFKENISKDNTLISRVHQTGYVANGVLINTEQLPVESLVINKQAPYSEQSNPFQNVDFGIYANVDKADTFQYSNGQEFNKVVTNLEKNQKKFASRTITHDGGNNKSIQKELRNDKVSSFTINGFSISDFHKRSKRYRLTQQKNGKKLKIKNKFNLGRFTIQDENLPLNDNGHQLETFIWSGLEVLLYFSLAIVTFYVLLILNSLILSVNKKRYSENLIEYKPSKDKLVQHHPIVLASYQQTHHFTACPITEHVVPRISQEVHRNQTINVIDDPCHEVFSFSPKHKACYIYNINITENSTITKRKLFCRKGQCEFNGMRVEVDPQIDISNVENLHHTIQKREVKLIIQYLETHDVIPKYEIVYVTEIVNEYLLGKTFFHTSTRKI